MAWYDAPTLTAEDVSERVDNLVAAHADGMADRVRIRQIMDGGAEGLIALLGPEPARKLNTTDFPVAHMLDAGLTRLAQKLGRPPDVRVDPSGHRDSAANRNAAEKRERIVVGLDYQTRLDLTFPYAARWLPGYAFCGWTICEGVGRNGDRYAKAEIRNSFDAYPGQWGPDSQPEEVAFLRLVSKKKLKRQYPVYAAAVDNLAGSRHSRVWTPNPRSWEGYASDLVGVAEYVDSSGTYLISMDTRTLLDIIPNPTSGPAFVFCRRPSFNALRGQYDHTIGLMAMMAKLNVLAYIATEDATFRETNVIGDMIGEKYQRGRFATNFFVPGTQIERPSADVAFQTFTQIDRLERQLRIGAQYSVIEDSESPNSWVTGRGLEGLTTAASHNITEYQQTLKYAVESLDAKRLEWEEKMYGDQSKRVTGNIRGMAISEQYTPSRHIAGNYETRRVYGVMAGWDEPEKIVTGIQLMGAGALDVETFQDNLDGLENRGLINERVRKRRAEDMLFQALAERAGQGDPRASMAMVEIYSSPEAIAEILTKFYTPEEPEMSAEEQMMAMMGGAGGMPPGGPGGAPPGATPEPVSTVLSRILGGEAQGGVQTVGRLAG